MITIKLTNRQADLLGRNIDGWLDAGACKDGLTEEETEALQSAHTQIMRQLIWDKKKPRKKYRKRSKPAASTDWPPTEWLSEDKEG